MTRLLASSAAVIALAATLAACGGGDDDGASGSTKMQSAGEQVAGQSTLSVEEIGDVGRVLVDSSGQALYTSDLEADGRVLCVDACLSFWKPITAEAGAPATVPSLPVTLGVVKRPDASRQITYEGMPLYSFTEEGPEEVTGDGFVDAFGGNEFTWSVVVIGGGASESADSGGRSFGY